MGRPNAGKSTLTNALVGSKVAITSAKPQTTRHTIRGIVHREDSQLILVDTPGLHRPRTLLGKRLNELVADTLAEVDAVGQGRVWTGAEALEIGLVDQIGTIEDAIRYAAMSIEGVTKMEDVQVVAYPKPQTALEAFMEAFGGTESAFAGTPMESMEMGKVYARLPYVMDIR